jgi:hypothetical protein
MIPEWVCSAWDKNFGKNIQHDVIEFIAMFTWTHLAQMHFQIAFQDIFYPQFLRDPGVSLEHDKQGQVDQNFNCCCRIVASSLNQTTLPHASFCLQVLREDNNTIGTWCGWVICDEDWWLWRLAVNGLGGWDEIPKFFNPHILCFSRNIRGFQNKGDNF